MDDIFKKSFLEGYASSDVSALSAFSALLITLVIGIYIFIVYKNITRKAFYSKNFNISLVGVALITAAIIITIQSSIVVSLGMVGALSIVRFRTAIKNPMDLMFLFWAISNGIICGAGYAIFAVVLSLFMTLSLLILDRFPSAKSPMVLVVNCSKLDSEDIVVRIIKEHVNHFTVKSRIIRSDQLNLTIELQLTNGKDLVKELIEIPGIETVSLLRHDGEVTL